MAWRATLAHEEQVCGRWGRVNVTHPHHSLSAPYKHRYIRLEPDIFTCRKSIICWLRCGRRVWRSRQVRGSRRGRDSCRHPTGSVRPTPSCCRPAWAIRGVRRHPRCRLFLISGCKVMEYLDWFQRFCRFSLKLVATPAGKCDKRGFSLLKVSQMQRKREGVCHFIHRHADFIL